MRTLHLFAYELFEQIARHDSRLERSQFAVSGSKRCFQWWKQISDLKKAITKSMLPIFQNPNKKTYVTYSNKHQRQISATFRHI
jgi:hypothetical protein